MMQRSQSLPGRHKGTAVRVMVQLAVGRAAPPPQRSGARGNRPPRELGPAAPKRAHVLEIALDSTLVHPTEGNGRTLCWCAASRVARRARQAPGEADLDRASRCTRIYRPRPDLAPFVRRLADSVRLCRRAVKAPGATMPAPTVVGAVDEQPALATHPPIRYPPEMQALPGWTILRCWIQTALDRAPCHQSPIPSTGSACISAGSGIGGWVASAGCSSTAPYHGRRRHSAPGALDGPAAEPDRVRHGGARTAPGPGPRR